MTPAPAEVAAVLEDAPRVLARYGWRQGPRTLEDIQTGRWPGFGLRDALWFAAEDAGVRFPFDVSTAAEGAVTEWLARPDAWPAEWTADEVVQADVDDWQDYPGRTLRDVVRACYGAARLVWPHKDRVPTDVPGALEAAAVLVESVDWRLETPATYQALATAADAINTAMRHRDEIPPRGMALQRAGCAITVMNHRLADIPVLPWRALAGELRAAAGWYRDHYQTTQDGVR